MWLLTITVGYLPRTRGFSGGIGRMGVCFPVRGGSVGVIRKAMFVVVPTPTPNRRKQKKWPLSRPFQPLAQPISEDNQWK